MALTKVTNRITSGAPISVVDYGADPTGSTDSTAAIQAAIAASGNIVFPAGTYLINDSLVLRSSCRWSGIGGATLVKSGTSPAITDTAGTPSDDWIVENLTIRVDGWPTVLAGSTGVDVGRSRRSSMRDVNIQGFANGFVMDKAELAVGNYYNTIERVKVYGATTSGEATTKSVTSFYVGTSGVGGGANANRFHDCESYGYSEYGLKINSVGSLFKGFHIELSANALTLEAGTSNCEIEVYAEATTGSLGSAAVTTEFNNIWIYRDGTGTGFVNSGFNTFNATTSLEASYTRNDTGFIEFTRAYSKAAASGPTNLFKITLPAYGAAKLELSAVTQSPSVNNWLEVSEYHLLCFPSTASATLIDRTAAATGTALTLTTSGADVIVSGNNSASATSDSKYWISARINGMSTNNTLASWQKILITSL